MSETVKVSKVNEAKESSNAGAATATGELSLQLEQYAKWRDAIASGMRKYLDWTAKVGLSDSVAVQRAERTMRRLKSDTLSVAFVAEFSRGKSELINAMFFGDYGRRLLPSAAGRTTMCPTELRYDADLPPCIRLLPIETRSSGRTTDDYREDPAAWTTISLDMTSVDAMAASFAQVSRTRSASLQEASSYGLYDEDDESIDTDAGRVQISYWRHAIINFPHPLLKSGLVIIDTPGLNSIGTEPELTLNIIPDAHVVLYVLAADTGVTKSDAAVWFSHIGGGVGRMVVLNKIDSMWDELQSSSEVTRQIDEQIVQVAKTLKVERDQVYPVSAQKGLVSKITKNPQLLERSRLHDLETAFTNKLMPAKRTIVSREVQRDVGELTSSRQALMSSLVRNVVEQLVELKSLRGKNVNVIDHMLKRVDAEKKEFDRSVHWLQGTRQVFARLSVDVFTALSLGSLKQDFDVARASMRRANMVTGFRSVVKAFFTQVRDNLLASSAKSDEIMTMLSAMYRKFSTEHSLSLPPPMPFSMEKYLQQLQEIEDAYHKEFTTFALLKPGLEKRITRFFDTIGSRIRFNLLVANRDVEAWLKVVMAPLEEQIRVHNDQLKNRIDSIGRVQNAIETLEDKISSIEARHDELLAQRETMTALEADLKRLLDSNETATVARA